MSIIFSTNNFVKYKLNIWFLNTHYLDLVRSKENQCMFFDVCNNLQIVCVMFYSILMCLLSNNFIDLFSRLFNI